MKHHNQYMNIEYVLHINVIRSPNMTMRFNPMQLFSFRSSNEIENDVKTTNDDHKLRRITTTDGKGKIIHF